MFISLQKLGDRNLLLFIGSLLLVDVIFSLVWHFIDPLTIGITKDEQVR